MCFLVMRQSSWNILLQQEKCPLGSLVEIGEIREVTAGMKVAGQYRVFVDARS